MPKWDMEKLKSFQNYIGTDVGWGLRSIHVYLSAAAFDWDFFERQSVVQWLFVPNFHKQDITTTRRSIYDLLEARIWTNQVVYYFRLDVSNKEGREHLTTLVRFLIKRGYKKAVQNLRGVTERNQNSETQQAASYLANHKNALAKAEVYSRILKIVSKGV